MYVTYQQEMTACIIFFDIAGGLTGPQIRALSVKCPCTCKISLSIKYCLILVVVVVQKSPVLYEDIII